MMAMGDACLFRPMMSVPRGLAARVAHEPAGTVPLEREIQAS